MKYDIFNRFSEEVQLSVDIECAENDLPSVKLGLAVRAAHKSDANLYDADLRGADLYDASLEGAGDIDKIIWGNDQITTIQPLFLSGLIWPVFITDMHIRIGCQVRLTSEWEGFSDREISAMDGVNAARFWSQWKDAILTLAKSHQSKVKVPE